MAGTQEKNAEDNIQDLGVYDSTQSSKEVTLFPSASTWSLNRKATKHSSTPEAMEFFEILFQRKPHKRFGVK